MKLASFKLDRVSLPLSVHGSPPLEQLLQPSDRKYLEDYQQLMLDSAEDLEVRPEMSYVDPILKRNTKVYRKFVRGVFLRGMVVACP